MMAEDFPEPQRYVEAFWRSFPPPVFVPSRWGGPQYLEGLNGEDDQATSLLVISAASPDERNWLHVRTSLDDRLRPGRPSRRWELLRNLGMASREDDRTLTQEEASARVKGLPWRATSLDVDGSHVPVEVVQAGAFWAAHGRVGDRLLHLMGAYLTIEDLSLEAVSDIEPLIEGSRQLG